MNDFLSIKDVLMASLQNFGQSISRVLPILLQALFLLVVGWLVARFLSAGISKLLNIAKFDQLATRFQISAMLEKADIRLEPSRLVGKLVYWVVLLLFFVNAADTLGWTAVSEQLDRLVTFLPTLLGAMVFFMAGTAVAGFVRDVLLAAFASFGFGFGRVLSTFVFYFFLCIVTLTALKQIGIDTSIITSNIVLILGAVLLSGSISYGFASREILSNILATFFSRKTFSVGQIIRIDDVEGEIIKIDSICVTLQTETDKIVIPSQELISKRVYIVDDSPEV